MLGRRGQTHVRRIRQLADEELGLARLPASENALVFQRSGALRHFGGPKWQIFLSTQNGTEMLD